MGTRVHNVRVYGNTAGGFRGVVFLVQSFGITAVAKDHILEGVLYTFVGLGGVVGVLELGAEFDPAFFRQGFRQVVYDVVRELVVTERGDFVDGVFFFSGEEFSVFWKKNLKMGNFLKNLIS